VVGIYAAERGGRRGGRGLKKDVQGPRPGGGAPTGGNFAGTPNFGGIGRGAIDGRLISPGVVMAPVLLGLNNIFFSGSCV
jgi:hypothetical protein